MKEQTKTLHANQQITFQVNFKKISIAQTDPTYPQGTFFLCGARMFDDDTSDAYPDPTEDSTYVLYISPLTNTTMIAKINENRTYDILNPLAYYVLDQTTNFTYISRF